MGHPRDTQRITCFKTNGVIHGDTQRITCFRINDVIYGDAERITIHTLFYFKNGGGSARCISAPDVLCGLFTRFVWVVDVVGEECTRMYNGDW